MIKFRQKDFSILSSTLRGAGIGAGIGIGSRGKLFRPISDKLAGKLPDFKPFKQTDRSNEISDLETKNVKLGVEKETILSKYKKSDPKTEVDALRLHEIEKEIKNNESNIRKNKENPNSVFNDPAIKVVGGLTILGAAMGLLVGVAKEVTNKFNNRLTVNSRIMKPLINSLNSKGLKEDRDFTRDPKRANELKTKICIVLSRISGDLNIRINHIKDPKLKTVSGKLISELPKSLTVSNNVSDKYNDIILTTVSKSSDDVKLMTEIITHFVRSGYPVYLIEVG